MQQLDWYMQHIYIEREIDIYYQQRYRETVRLHSVPQGAHFYSQYITTSEGLNKEAHSRAARKEIHQKVCQWT